MLMATTSTEVGGLFAEGRGHEIAQGYGMFLWAAVVLYAAVAWRLRARGGRRPIGLEPLRLAVGSHGSCRGKDGRNDSCQVEDWLTLHVVRDVRSLAHARPRNGARTSADLHFPFCSIRRVWIGRHVTFLSAEGQGGPNESVTQAAAEETR